MYRPYSGSLADSRPFMDVESQIRGLAQDYATSFNTGNYDQAARMFAPDGVLMAPHHDAANGQKAVERVLREFGESGYVDMRVETVRVENSGDMAMEEGRYSVTIRQANGTLMPERGKYVKVWRRLGAWLILADCWSRNPPANR
ncbi:MAG: nuclear transport factor 2 family protein [Acidobacteriia bacterium]|nr:nuclear transport factor 2 family protein [Terriglobia bacterium]